MKKIIAIVMILAVVMVIGCSTKVVKTKTSSEVQPNVTTKGNTGSSAPHEIVEKSYEEK